MRRGPAICTKAGVCGTPEPLSLSGFITGVASGTASTRKQKQMSGNISAKNRYEQVAAIQHARRPYDDAWQNRRGNHKLGLPFPIAVLLHNERKL